MVVSQSSNRIEGYSDNQSKLFCNEGCIVFGDHTRNVKLLMQNFIVGADGVKLIIPRINLDFAYYLILHRSLIIENRGYSRHFQYLITQPFAIPPESEQEEIAKKLRQYFELINTMDQTSNNISDLVTRTKSKILDLAMQGKLVPQDPTDEPAADMLRRINPEAKIITDNPHYPQLPDNWVLTTIDSVCHYGNTRTIAVSDIGEDDWVLELEDMESYTGRLLHAKMKKERAISGVRHSFKSGDILFSRLRTYLNKVLPPKKDGFCSTEIIPITPFKCVTQEYLYYWLRSSFFVEYTISCGYGVKMPRLSTSDANKAIVPLPPLEEQKRIVDTFQRLQTYTDGISNSLN